MRPHLKYWNRFSWKVVIPTMRIFRNSAVEYELPIVAWSSGIACCLSVVGIALMVYGSIGQALYPFTFPGIIACVVIAAKEFIENRVFYRTAILASPAIPTGIMVGFAWKFADPGHGNFDPIESQRAILTDVTAGLFWIGLAWLLIMPFLVSEKRWRAILISFLFLPAHAMLGFLFMMVVSGVWL